MAGCLQRVAQELHLKLTFIAELTIHLIELAVKAPNFEGGCRGLMRALDSPQWFEEATRWLSRLGPELLILGNFSMGSMSGATETETMGCS